VKEAEEFTPHRLASPFYAATPYMERGAKRPDLPQLAQATVRAAVAAAVDLLPGIPPTAGRHSFHVPVRIDREDAQIPEDVLNSLWTDDVTDRARNKS
jgi:hypothetical protein